jgi:uncharacterized Zn-finger protein
MPTETPDVIAVESTRIACDGGAKERGAALGHPKVWLEMGEDHSVVCPYCGRKFVLKSGASGH